MRFSWENLRDLILLVLGVCVVAILLNVGAKLNEVDASIIENRIAVCRLTRELGLTFDPDGPCAQRDVQDRLEELSYADG